MGLTHPRLLPLLSAPEKQPGALMEEAACTGKHQRNIFNLHVNTHERFSFTRQAAIKEERTAHYRRFIYASQEVNGSQDHKNGI